MEAEFTNAEAERLPGTGPTRIGKPFRVRTDLYSRLFISTLHTEYIHAIWNKNENDEALRDELHCQEHDIYDDECTNCKEEAGLLLEKDKEEGQLEEGQMEEGKEEEDVENGEATGNLGQLERKEDLGEDPLEESEEENEFELSKSLEQTDLDKLDELREEMNHDRKQYAFKLIAVWFF